MLTIYDVTSATDAKNYYASSVSPEAASARRDYYSEGQESPGLYGGKLAEELGLAGKIIDKETFDRLCDNLRPDGTPLTQRTNDYRRVCKDFTFSGPKSFSIIEAFASEDERKALRQAFDESVTETVAEDIEPDMQCREREGGADHDITTGNVLTAGVNHYTSRAGDDQSLPDMHLHRHLLIWNATKRPDGRIMAAQFGNIVRDKGYIRAAFYARLASKLEHLGFEIDRRGGNEWEIAGVPQTAIDKFSKRTAQIDAAAKELNIVDPATKAELGAKIRAKKQKELTLPELRKAWDAQLTAAEREALAAVYRKDIAPGKEVTAAEAVAYALHHCLERESCLPERELKREALLYGLGHVTPQQIAAELPRAGVITGERDGRVMATTKKTHAEELFITGFAAGGRGTVRPVGISPELERGKLDDEQWAAVTGLLSSHDRINLVDSAAGVGKTTALKTFDQGMRLAGRAVTYLGMNTKAVGVLQKDGFAAETVAKFLLSDKMQAAASNAYLVVDESSMLGHADAFKLFNIAKDNNITLTFLGDSRQHSSVTAGSFMRLLRQYGGVTPFRISTIKRQENAEHRAAIGLMFEGRTLEGMEKIDGLKWIHEIDDADARYRAMAAEYVEALKSGESWDQVLLLSPTHAEGQRVVDAVRDLLRQEEMIDGKDHEFTRWVSSDLTEAQRGDSRNYAGKVDMLQFHRNAKGHKIGERVELAGIDPAALPLDQASSFQAYRKETIKLAVGDVLRFTANGQTLDKHQIRNGSAYKVAGFTARGIRLENGWLVSKDFGHFKYGIETSPGSQSMTVSRAIIGQSSQSFGAGSMEQAYVSASRAKKQVTFYTDDKAALFDAVRRSSLKLAASDIVPSAARPIPAARSRWRQRMAHFQHLASLARTRMPWHGPAVNPAQIQQERQMGYGR